MKYHSYFCIRVLPLMIGLWLSAFYVNADEAASLRFQGLKDTFFLGEKMIVNLDTTLISSSFVELVDLWVAIQQPNSQLLFLTSTSTNHTFGVIPQPFKQEIVLAETSEPILQIDALAVPIGNYIFYAIYSPVNTDFDQLLVSKLSNLASTSIILAQMTGLEKDPRSSNTTCLAPPRPTEAISFPKKLSETGCVLSDNPLQPVSGLIPYTVNVPLWKEGASLVRWMAVPTDEAITVDENGDWIFPMGSMLLKYLYLEEKPVEAQLLVRHDDGDWAGYNYEWDDDGNDATLLEKGKRKEMGNGQTWTYLNRKQCLKCHTKAAGGTIGLEMAQMNRLHTYPSTGHTASQIDTLTHIGLLEKSSPTSELPAFPKLTNDDAPIGERARAFLHTNCSHCHRPHSTGPHDYRVTVPLSDLCFETEISGSPKVHLITAGDIEYSRISQRLHRGEMPPLGTKELNQGAITLIDEWINSLDSCLE
jgi:uncharacterized repeat protein (TIGR03806 family)